MNTRKIEVLSRHVCMSKLNCPMPREASGQSQRSCVLIVQLVPSRSDKRVVLSAGPGCCGHCHPTRSKIQTHYYFRPLGLVFSVVRESQPKEQAQLPTSANIVPLAGECIIAQSPVLTTSLDPYLLRLHRGPNFSRYEL